MYVRYGRAVEQMAMHVNSLGLVAAQAAFSGECDEWLADLRLYLEGNCDLMVDFVCNELPGIRSTNPQATYLAWWDCSELVRTSKIASPPQAYFLERARVALNDGKEFGMCGEGFVRLNFGCQRKLLQEALLRIKSSLA
jgi:cysteine-S-conjugate beta-lyase